MNILTDGSRVHVSPDHKIGVLNTGNPVTALVKYLMHSNCILDNTPALVCYSQDVDYILIP